MIAPVVSVLMPCYNARESLPWAIGSVLAQTCEDWELVIIDDGSSDRPEDIVEQADDPRIRLIHLPENRGRGAARQVALDHARGEFVCMLDADDWMYPRRIAVELETLQQEPSVDLVSAGLTIVDRNQDIAGVRMTGNGQSEGPFYGIACPVAHAPSMFRRSAAQGIGFDSALRMGEDQDFLIRLLQGRRYMILPEPLYAYTELESVSARKSAHAQRFRRRTIRKHRRTHPGEVALGIIESCLKEGAYRAGSLLGLDEAIIGRRSSAATPAQIEDFVHASRIVNDVVLNRFNPA